MRLSAVLASLIAAPAMFIVTACTSTSDTPEPLHGIVVDEEYKPAQHGTKKVAETVERCTRNTKGKRTCTTSKTGRLTELKYLKRSECYEVEVQLNDTHDVIDVCDEGAYNALEPGDHYDSSKDYSEAQR